MDNQFSLSLVIYMHVWDDLLFTVWYCDAAMFVRELKFSGKNNLLSNKGRVCQ